MYTYNIHINISISHCCRITCRSFFQKSRCNNCSMPYWQPQKSVCIFTAIVSYLLTSKVIRAVNNQLSIGILIADCKITPVCLYVIVIYTYMCVFTLQPLFECIFGSPICHETFKNTHGFALFRFVCSRIHN